MHSYIYNNINRCELYTMAFDSDSKSRNIELLDALTHWVDIGYYNEKFIN